MPNNFSVQLVDSNVNNFHGNALGFWYANNRVTRSDKFWIKFID
jgi:hypothetical protein